MHLALRPYVTTGVALVGAGVIAVAPMQPVVPTDIQIANPAVEAVERGVQLTANEIENAVNQLVFAATKAGVSVAQLTTPLVARVLGISEPAAAQFLALGTIGLLGPFISGTGAVGTALQDIVDSDGLEDLVLNLIGGPGTILDGTVNGGYGPNVGTLAGFPAALVVLAGGLIGENNFPPIPGATPPFNFGGLIPTTQGLVEQLFGLFSPAAPMTAQNVSTLAAPVPDSTIEDGINSLVFALTKATLSVVTLAAPLVAPILGVTEPEAKAFLALGTVGLLGPLISGTGAAGTALQNIVNSDGVEELLNNLIGAPGTLADGVVNGGYGPNLQSLLPFLPPALPPGIPVTGVFAPGIIQNPGFDYSLLAATPLAGLGVRLNGSPIPSSATLLPPGTIAVLQGLVERVFGALPSNQMATLKAPADDQTLTIKSEQNNLKLSENSSAKELEDQTNTEGPEVTPKKHRQQVNLNLLNPLGNLSGAKKADEKAPTAASSNDATTGKHRIGTPVRDLINKVFNGDRDDNDSDAGTASEPKDEAPAAQ